MGSALSLEKSLGFAKINLNQTFPTILGFCSGFPEKDQISYGLVNLKISLDILVQFEHHSNEANSV